MKTLITLLLLVAVGAFAHDEGHGPKIVEAAKRGGVLAAVLDTKNRSVDYKAELVRTGGKALVYIYDTSLESTDTSSLSKTAKGVLEVKRRKDASKTQFDLELKEGLFEGVLPKTKGRPFDIEVSFKRGDKNYQVVFENLD